MVQANSNTETKYQKTKSTHTKYGYDNENVSLESLMIKDVSAIILQYEHDEYIL